MANAVYTLSYSDRCGDAWTVEIWSKAVNTNPAIAIKGSNSPLKLNWRTVTDIFEPVLVSEAVLEVISETDLQWKDFFTANRGDWILKVQLNGTMIWQGQNITESYSEPYLVTPYTSQLRFSDLGDMDFIYYRPTSNTFYSGFQSLAEIIFNCTNKLEFQLDANEYTNCINLEGWNNAAVTDKSLLCNTFLDASMFRKYENNQETAMTCMEVLKKVLYSIGCRIIQASEAGLNGVSKWHIQRIEEMIDSDDLETFGLDHTTKAVTASLYSNNFARSITNLREFANPTLDICPVNQNQDLGMSERHNRVLHKYTTQEIIRNNAELLFNGAFDKGVKTANNTNKFPKYFQPSSDISSSNVCQVGALFGYNKKLMFQAMQAGTSPPYAGMLAAQGTSLSTIASYGLKYIRTTGTESGDAVDAQTALMSDIPIATVDYLKLKITGLITKGVDWSKANSLGVNNENYITAPIFHFGVKVKLTYDSGNTYTWYMSHNYPGNGYHVWTSGNGIVKRILGTKGFINGAVSGISYLDDKFEIDLNSPYFPEDGTGSFSLWLYVPRTESAYMNPIGLAEAMIEDISLRYVTDGNFSDTLIKNTTFFSLTDAKENLYTFDLYLGDGPADYCISSFRYGVVSSANQYKKTSSWRKLDDATSQTAANLFNIVPAKKLISGYQRIISGDYIGRFDIVNTLNIDDGVVDKRYLIMGDSWDTKASVHSVVMREITDQSISVTSYSEASAFPTPKTPGNSTLAQPKGASVFSAKTINNSIVLNAPVSLTLQQIQTKYPG